mmetsp:Transcript_21780/g.46016  ORF Transcript_21780/g.46016 Transcript_21780/m.46016 type:complete len:341 (-) Transcript_21780:316-1338(-)
MSRADVYRNRPPARAAAVVAPRGEMIARANASAHISELRGLSGYARHRRLLVSYHSAYGDSSKAPPPMRTDADAIRESHRFLWDEGEDAGAARASALSWEQRLAKRYHDRLFKEYALADMARYREGAIGLRWRTEKEVFDGRGQFTCGNKACTSNEHLSSFELNFAYVEHGERKQALVKLRLCRDCAEKLHYKKRKEQRREERRAAKREARARRKRRRSADSCSHSDSHSAGAGDNDDNGNGDGDGKERRAASAKHKQKQRRGEFSERNPGATSSHCGRGGKSDEGETRDDGARDPKSDVAGEAGAEAGADIWRKKPVLEKTQGEEFDEYFDEFCGSLLV